MLPFKKGALSLTLIKNLLSIINPNFPNKSFTWDTLPKYTADTDWIQNSDQSITTPDGRYDLKHFSKHETETINHTVRVVKEKYPLELRSMGFANESALIKYKPRYILWEMLVQLYKDSTDPIDKFACALAYEAKGAIYREDALQKFEDSINYITPEFMQLFTSYTPLCVYMKFSRLYERNHEYEKAIYYTKQGQKYGEKYNPNFDKRIAELIEKIKRNPKKRKYNPSKGTLEFEKYIENATKHFIKKLNLTQI